MKRNICIFKTFFVCLSILSALSSNLSAQNSKLDSIDVSLLTCQPHDEVYSLYGHTAIRVNNHTNGQDIAVNYGVFDPSAGNFVLRFVFGLTDYCMGICSYEDFLAEYRYFGSGVYEQRLNLTPDEKAQLLRALAENARPENIVYRYNYFYNNCTTKARDVLLNAVNGEVEYKPLTHLQKSVLSFRQLIHMKNEDHRWARLGNDLLLGFQADLNTNHDEREFLPEILAEDFDSASVSTPDGLRRNLVDTAYWALAPGKAWHDTDAGLVGEIAESITPLQCSWIVFCVILAFVMAEVFSTLHFQLSTFRSNLLACHSKNFQLFSWAHYFIYCLYAVPGIILFLMLFSQHPTVRLNIQIFMFCPLFFLFALPKVYKKWGRWAILFCLAVFFIGNIFQDYAEGANVLALALLTTFLPDYFVNSKKSSNFAC